ncbi:MAG TPA: ABC transporter permease [Phenylobacterium sp.]|uniref:MlaE family ABC transporter permease n=1 Tax=Phenylobacterium sp. TaxID=1871053 RepID=UPI002CE680E8|nr:ABC transporter permease [Phenylobacterium sp.]HSV03264.1 ABC transporter permease [Phenylobacterium sp.]
MDSPAEFKVEPGERGPAVALSGDWTANDLGAAPAALRRALARERPAVLDFTGVGRLDTAGAFAVIRAAGSGFDLAKVRARPETLRLIGIVAEAAKAGPPPPPAPSGFHELTIRIGKGVVNLALEGLDTMVFLGHLLVVLGRSLVNLLVNPRRIRWAAVVSQMERAGLDAIPIVAVTSFFIGAVIALLGINQLRQFGAEVFSVELIGIAVLREFGIVITAVLLAGRSASAFAAELGAMKMNQEIDAMQVMGVDPFEALVFPRFAALLVTIPLLTFVAVLAGLFGGLMVTWSVLGLGPAFFLQRMLDNVGVTHFWVGLSKAPVMAAVIAGVGCRQGMEVGVDVESLGRRVTAAVVHAIFAIIMIDAAFALVYMELDL